MRLIAGLGHPGPEYRLTRHNIGFQCLDLFAKRHRISITRRQDQALAGHGVIADTEVILAKPQTFMNLSGIAIAALLRRWRIPPADMVVVCDDLDLPLGRVRLRAKGSSGGQRGLRSIIDAIGTEEFPRLRVGIGRPVSAPGIRGRREVVDHVLDEFAPDEEAVMQKARARVLDVLDCILTEGVDAAMNRYNSL